MIEVRYRDIDPDTGEISSCGLICRCKDIDNANWIKLAIERDWYSENGPCDPNREFYIEVKLRTNVEGSVDVYTGEARWGRAAWLKIEEDRIVFDCSDEEYGPIEFNLQLLLDVLESNLDKNEEDI
jgi:hypothetical protein